MFSTYLNLILEENFLSMFTQDYSRDTVFHSDSEAYYAAKLAINLPNGQNVYYVIQDKGPKLPDAARHGAH